MREIVYQFSGTSLKFTNKLLHHDFLVVVDGVIKTPHNEWRCGGDYRIEGNLILFETRLEGVCVQMIPVTVTLAPSKTPARPLPTLGLKPL